MKTDTRSDYTTRDAILKILSDAEIASVSAAESADHLRKGEEYLDLKHLVLGVQRATDGAISMGHVLPKRSVHEATWAKLLAHLPPRIPGSAGPRKNQN